MKMNLLIIIAFAIFFNCKNERGNFVGVDGTQNKINQKQKSPYSETKKDTISLKDLVIGKVNYENQTIFEKVPSEYSVKSMYLNKEALSSFIKMAKDAKKVGISIKIISGARNFDYQKGIWERKWNTYSNKDSIQIAKSILKFSSMPMTSRHHWGTDMDLNSLDNHYFTSGAGLKMYNWMQKNASKYGFCQVYTDKKDGRTGYEMEKWHWSYMPLAKKYLDFYNKNVTYKDIKGFKGSNTAKRIGSIENYVNGIHHCD